MTRVDKHGTPRICEHCDLLRHVHTKSSTNDCPVCASPPACLIYALIHQNTFAQRWSEIQLEIQTTPTAQIHTSLNSPSPIGDTTPQSQLGNINTPNLTPPIDSTNFNCALTLQLPNTRLDKYVRSSRAHWIRTTVSRFTSPIQLCRYQYAIYTCFNASYALDNISTYPPGFCCASPENHGIVNLHSMRYIVACHDR